ncbi:MAG: hypothetical protein ACNS62_14160 [Candidatus Cyclobacteriaceae bacterium M3_2C_046]
MKIQKLVSVILLGLILTTACNKSEKTDLPDKIDRKSLVTRHNPVIHEFDSLDVLTVGNGDFAFTVDPTGLQTFPESYEEGIPLGTQTNWAWQSFPNPEDYTLNQVVAQFPSCEDSIPYLYRFGKGEKGAASEYLRQNPHRLHLGLIGYEIRKSNGEVITMEDVQDIDFSLDMWTGSISSTFYVENEPVQTRLFAHQQHDQVAVQVTSPLIAAGRLTISLRFPNGTGCHRCSGYDFTQAENHTTQMSLDNQQAIFERLLDSTRFFVKASWEQPANMEAGKAHHYFLKPDPANQSFNFAVSFAPDYSIANQSFEQTRTNNEESWSRFWNSGAAIDFTGSTDPRADELERRVILSQYLTKIQTSGDLPPQETGLTFNSWYGKFHLEMHWWHGVHFMLWDRPQLLANSMPYYHQILPQARAIAQGQGFSGARWPKMTGPFGKDSPSGVGPFLVWQQPHPIYYAELFYRHDPSDSVLNYYKDIVFETAEFMASFPTYNEALAQYDLCHPLIPAQEVFKLDKTDNPIFELAYWHYALNLAQQWRKRLGMQPHPQWQQVLDKLAPYPVKDGLYLPHQNRPDAYTDSQYRVDHPIVLGTLGFLPETEKLDVNIMKQTFDEVWRGWAWDRTWGWDYPLIAMSAARLGEPAKAIDALFMDVQKNTYLKNGHNYQDARLSIYLPGNGGLLTAVAMMAAGWDGSEGENPGFPRDGSWQVKWEGLRQMP